MAFTDHPSSAIPTPRSTVDGTKPPLNHHDWYPQTTTVTYPVSKEAAG